MQINANRSIVRASFLIALVAACGRPPTQPGEPGGVKTFTFDFREGPQGWQVGAPQFYGPGIVSDYRPLVGALATQGSAFFAKLYFSYFGDVGLVFLKKQVVGLTAGALYSVRFSGEIASNTPTGCGGIDAPPDSTSVYAGATASEPTVSQAPLGQLQASFKLASPTLPSSDGVYLGNVGTSTPCPNFSVWQLKTLDTPASIQVKADPAGTMWLHLATGTGYSDYVTLYFTRFSATFTPASSGN